MFLMEIHPRSVYFVHKISTMLRTGIWMDYKEANIIHLKDKGTEVLNIESNIEPHKPRGGSKSKSAWGPVDTVSESKYLERRKRQEADYLKV